MPPFGWIKWLGLNQLSPNYIRITISGNNWQRYKAMYNICYTLELIIEIWICSLYFVMYFKTLYFTSVHLFTNFCNI
jgi:hypothetical protein